MNLILQAIKSLLRSLQNSIRATQKAVADVENKADEAKDIANYAKEVADDARAAVNEKADKSDLPTALPNPHALTFTGAVEGTYDGSAPLEIEVPEAKGYTLPVASETALGGVKASAKTEDMTQPVGIGEDGYLWSDSDWNKMTNKPFGEVVWETSFDGTVTVEGDSAPYVDLFSTYFALVIGDEYEVELDGETYNLVCFENSGAPIVGSAFGEWTDEMPFTVVTVNNGTLLYHLTAGDHTLKIQHKTTTKLDEKYIDNNILRYDNPDALLLCIDLGKIINMPWRDSSDYTETFDCSTAQWIRAMHLCDASANYNALLVSDGIIASSTNTTNGNLNLFFSWLEMNFTAHFSSTVVVFDEDAQTVTCTYTHIEKNLT